MKQTVAARVPFEPPRLLRACFTHGRSFMIEADGRRDGGIVSRDSAQLRRSPLDYADQGTIAVRSFRSDMRDSKAGAR